MNSARELTFKELTWAEKQFIITTFAEAVDAHACLKAMRDSKKWVEYSTVLKALNIHDWPNSKSSPVELAWCSASLHHSGYTRLGTYSVFWTQSLDNTSNRIELWIGRTPHRPVEESGLLGDVDLVWAVIQTYGIRVLEVRKYYSIPNKVWRYRWLLLFRVVVPVVVACAMLTVGFLQLGFTILAFSAGITFLSTNVYGSILTRRWGPSGILFGYFVPLFFVSPYVTGLLNDDSLTPATADPVNTVGLFLALMLGVILALVRAIHEDETWDDLKRTRFRSSIRLFVFICVATTTGFGIHVGHSFALRQVVVEGNELFVLLIGCGVVTYYAFLVSLLRQNDDQ